MGPHEPPEPRRSPTLGIPMRPLFVILLVAGAVAALLFALTSLTGGGDDSGQDRIVTPPADRVLAAETAPGELLVPGRMAQELPDATGARRAVDTGEEIQVATDGYIAGIVVDSGEGPVAGALVQLIRQKGAGQFAALQQMLGNRPTPKPVKETNTDELGGFRFDRVQPGGDWTLVVLHKEFSRTVVGPIEVRKTGGATERVVLDRGFEIFGVVTDAGSKMPLAGAHVVLDNPAAAFMPSTRLSPDRLETVSGPDGTYSIPNIPPANRALTVTMEGFATQIDQRSVIFTDVEETRRRVDIEMQPGYLIAGRVVGPDGSGVPGVQVDAIGNGTPSSRGSALSKQGGEFLISDLAEGRYTLRVVADGYDRDPLQADAGDRNVEIKLSARGGLMGVVLRPGGGPVRDFQLKIRQLHPTNVAFGHVHLEKNVTGSKDGTFVVEGLKPGSYVVQADARGFASSFSGAAVVEEGLTTPDVQVIMSKGGTVVGQVLDPETKQPLPGVKVTTQNTNWIDSDFTIFLDAMAPTAITRANVTTDEEGRFKIELMTPEAYQLTFKKDGYTATILNGIEVGTDQTLDLNLVSLTRGGTVRGTAYLASGEPAANVRVSLKPLDEGQMFHGASSRSDAEGRFLLSNIAAGRYALSCASAPKPGVSPLMSVVDMEKSKVEIEILNGEEYLQDLYLGGN